MNEEKRCPIWTQARAFLVKLLQVLVLYLDDLLLISGGCCFVWAAWEGVGQPAGLAVSGICLWLAAWLIARSRRGGSG